MSITGVSSVDTFSQTPQQATNPRQDLSQLFDAVRNGDLATAQQVYDDLAQRVPAALKNSTIGRDFDALGQALQSGDVSAAQQSVAELQQDLQAAGRVHRHHHGHRQHDKDKTSSTEGVSHLQGTEPNDPSSLIGSTLRVKA
jgi:hypothetical protein